MGGVVSSIFSRQSEGYYTSSISLDLRFVRSFLLGEVPCSIAYRTIPVYRCKPNRPYDRERAVCAGGSNVMFNWSGAFFTFSVCMGMYADVRKSRAQHNRVATRFFSSQPASRLNMLKQSLHITCHAMDACLLSPSVLEVCTLHAAASRRER